MEEEQVQQIINALDRVAKETTLAAMAGSLGTEIGRSISNNMNESNDNFQNNIGASLSGALDQASSALTGALGATTSALVGAGGMLTSGNARLSDGFGVLEKSLGGSGNILSRTFGMVGMSGKAVAEYLEGSVDAFRDLSSVGAGAAGNLNALREQAAAARISFDDFNKIISENTESLAGFAGGVVAGRQQFAELSRTLFEFDEGANVQSLYNLGYSFEEMNELLADNIALTRRRELITDQQLKDAVESATALAKQQDLLAKLTGKNVDTIRDEARSRLQEGATNAKIRLLEKAGVEGAAEAFTAAQNELAASPEVVRNLLSQVTQLGVPLDEETKAFAAFNSNTYALVEQLAGIMQDDTLSATERRRQSEALAQEINATQAAEADSITNLSVATLGNISETARVQANALEETGMLIDNLRQNITNLDTETGETVTIISSFNESLAAIMSDLEANQNAQVTDGNALLNAARETDIFLRNASSSFNTELSQLFERPEVLAGLNEISQAIADANDPSALNAALETASELIIRSDSIQSKIETLLDNPGNFGLDDADVTALQNALTQIEEAMSVINDPTASGAEVSAAQNLIAEVTGNVSILGIGPNARTAFQELGNVNSEALTDAVRQGIVDGNIESNEITRNILEGSEEDAGFISGLKNLFGFNEGTLGETGELFRNFGGGTPAMLHGEEAVIPRDSIEGDILAAFHNGEFPSLMQGTVNLTNSVPSIADTNSISSNLSGLFNSIQDKIETVSSTNFDPIVRSIQDLVNNLQNNLPETSGTQTSQYGNQAPNQEVVRRLEELNTTMQMAVAHLAQSNRYGKDSVRAQQAMTGNLFQGVG